MSRSLVPVPSADWENKFGIPPSLNEENTSRPPSGVQIWQSSGPGSNCDTREPLARKVPGPDVQRLIADIERDTLAVGRDPRIQVGPDRRPDGFLAALPIDRDERPRWLESVSAGRRVHQRPIAGHIKIGGFQPACVSTDGSTGTGDFPRRPAGRGRTQPRAASPPRRTRGDRSACSVRGCRRARGSSGCRFGDPRTAICAASTPPLTGTIVKRTASPPGRNSGSR